MIDFSRASSNHSQAGIVSLPEDGISELDSVHVQFCFYRSGWLNRLLTRHRFGHVNFRVEKTLINYSRVPELAGSLYSHEYPWTPDAVVQFSVPSAWLRQIIVDASTPMTLKTLFRKNCCRAAAFLLTGNPERLDVLREIADCL
jgi:hypothetical protein